MRSDIVPGIFPDYELSEMSSGLGHHELRLRTACLSPHQGKGRCDEVELLSQSLLAEKDT